MPIICSICIILAAIAASSSFSPGRRDRSSSYHLAGGFGKKTAVSVPTESSGNLPKGKDSVTPDPNLRYVTKRGNGACVIDNHCPTFNIQYPGIRAVHSDPPVFEIDDFFSKEMCESYIAKSEKGTEIACQPLAGAITTKRTSRTKFLDYEDSFEIVNFAQILTGIDPKNYEEPQVVRYLPGQQFTWHYDAIQPHLMDRSGNRIATLIVYLNDCEEGGETAFRDLELKVKPKRGKALIFFPSFKDGIIDDRTLHCGSMAVDEKWIAQIWIRQGEYTSDMRESLRNIQIQLHKNAQDKAQATG